MKKIAAAFFIFFALNSLPVFSYEAETYSALLEAYKTDNTRRALQLIKKIDAEGNLTADVYLLKYEIYKKANKISLAKECLKKAVEVDPDCYEGLVALAVFAIEDGDSRSAKQYFGRAIEVNPYLSESSEILYYYAKICITDKDFDSALENILEAIQLNGDEKSYYLELGKIYLYKNDYLKAVNALEYALGDDSGINSESYNYMGLANYKRGNFKQALTNFQKAVEIAPYNILFLNNLALCYKSLNDKENFFATVNKIERIKPSEAEDFIQLAALYLDRKNYAAAKKILEEGLALYPDNLLLKTFYEDVLNKLNKT